MSETIVIGDTLEDSGLIQLTVDMSVDDVKRAIRSWDAYQSERGGNSIETVFFVMSGRGSGTITLYESDPSPPKDDYSMSDFVAPSDKNNEPTTQERVVAGVIVESHSWENSNTGLLEDLLSVLTAS